MQPQTASLPHVTLAKHTVTVTVQVRRSYGENSKWTCLSPWAPAETGPSALLQIRSPSGVQCGGDRAPSLPTFGGSLAVWRPWRWKSWLLPPGDEAARGKPGGLLKQGHGQVPLASA